jgi:hypothetical protein
MRQQPSWEVGTARAWNARSRINQPVSSVNRSLQCRAKHSARTRFLGKNDETDILGIGAGFKLDLDLAAEILPFLQLADFCQALQNSSVRWMFAAIFAAQDLGLRMTERDRPVDVGIVGAEVPSTSMRARSTAEFPGSTAAETMRTGTMGVVAPCCRVCLICCASLRGRLTVPSTITCGVAGSLARGFRAVYFFGRSALSACCASTKSGEICRACW